MALTGDIGHLFNTVYETPTERIPKMNAKRKCFLVLLSVAASFAAEAVVYRDGLRQVHGSVMDYLNGIGDTSWDAMNRLDPYVFMAGYAVPDDTDYTMGAFVLDLGDDQNGSTDEPHTAENPVSGREWGWTGDKHFYGYIGQMWLEAGVTYQMFCKSDDWAKLYVDGEKIADRNVGHVTPSTTGWHEIGVFTWDNDWMHGFYEQSEALSGACWNTNGVTVTNNEGFEHWKRFLTDGTAGTDCRLRVAYADDFVTAAVSPTTGGYRFVLTSSSSSPAQVRVHLSAESDSAEEFAVWAASSAAVTVPAGGTQTVDVSWSGDGVPYYVIYAEGQDLSFNEGYRGWVQWSTPASCVAAGVCTWTGAAGDFSWNNVGNWDTGRVPMLDDTARFADGIAANAVVTVAASAQVATIVIDTAVDFEIASSDGARLSFAGIVFGEGGLGNVTVSADCLFEPGADGTNRIDVASGASLAFTGDVDAASSAVAILKTGAGEAVFEHENASIATTKPTFTVAEGSVSAEKAKCIGGTLYIGGGEAAAVVSNGVKNATAKMSVYICTNGVFCVVGNYDWDTMPTYYIYRGGRCLYGGRNKCGKIHFYGGEIGAMEGFEAAAGLASDGDPEQNVYANEYMSVMSVSYRLAGNEYPFKFNVRRGTAPVDLLISAQLYGTGKDTNTHYKKGDGIVVCTATNSFPATDTRGVGFEIREGVWIADGEAAFGDCKAWVKPGGTLGGTGVIGDTADTADLDVTGTASVPETTPAVYATVRPGSIVTDESSELYGSRVYGTLTVGGGNVANNAVFGDASRLEIGFGGARAADRLSVKGEVSLSAVDSVLRLVNEAGADKKVFGGTYVVLEAEGGLTGTFASVDSDGFRHAPTVRYTATQVLVDVPASGFALILR